MQKFNNKHHPDCPINQFYNIYFRCIQRTFRANTTLVSTATANSEMTIL